MKQILPVVQGNMTSQQSLAHSVMVAEPN